MKVELNAVQGTLFFMGVIMVPSTLHGIVFIVSIIVLRRIIRDVLRRISWHLFIGAFHSKVINHKKQVFGSVYLGKRLPEHAVVVGLA
jgi:hypothetical protein